MKADTRIGGYLLVLLALAGALLISPAAWASSGQMGRSQTIPTLTPKGSSPTDRPTSRPPAATATPRPPAATATPQIGAAITPTPSESQTVTPSVTPIALGSLALTLEVDRSLAWAGTELHYTLTLANQGTGVTPAAMLEITLPDGLAPADSISAPAVAWDGPAGQVSVNPLLPGEEQVLTFSAVVGDDVLPGAVLVVRADATADGEVIVSASVAVALPPAELPATGACGQR